jgi:hypothetical protein
VAPISPATFGRSNSNIARNRSLFLVDATGSYPVRALALGGGMTTVVIKKKKPMLSTTTIHTVNVEEKSDNSISVAVADEVNQRLCHVDFSNLSAKQGLKRVLTLLAGNHQQQHQQRRHDAIIEDSMVSNSDNNEENDDHPALLAHDTRLELAVAYFDKQGFTRLGLSSLFNQRSSSWIQ